MKINKLYVTLGLIIAFALFFELAAHADESNESTKITFSGPTQIPGQILPAGTYTFQRGGTVGDSGLIQIFNADRTRLYATVQTVSAERFEPAGDTIITLAERGAGQPGVLVKWFYPGRTIGHEFVYSKQQEQALAQARQETFVCNNLMSPREAPGE